MKKKSQPASGFACMECGKKFRTIAAAGKAAQNGCPGCGGVDIDLDVEFVGGSKRECKTCSDKALTDSKYCGICWALATQNGKTQYLIDDDRRNS